MYRVGAYYLSATAGKKHQETYLLNSRTLLQGKARWMTGKGLIVYEKYAEDIQIPDSCYGPMLCNHGNTCTAGDYYNYGIL